ncbi:A disintegrin and metalloproteinase with thrombospondin motifs adt-1-like [Tachypleus tridentatus]|uniref:A disintegrin and metalloproteinase with thrombospondin motifs adt-1-like n=1 Tax=Tachypleus tridentatus TaxID=6853 RepID=UPI003FD2818F
MGVQDMTKGLGLLLFMLLVDKQVVALQPRMEWLGEDPIEADYEVVYPKVHHVTRDRRSLDQTEVLMTIRKNNTTLYVQLNPNTDLTLPNLTVSITRKDGTSQFFQPSVLSSDDPCLFTGRIINDKGGQVALSTCDDDGKMYGIVSTPDGVYNLQPVSQKVRRSIDANDDIYPHTLIRNSNKDSFCGLDGNDGGLRTRNDVLSNKKNRRRRQSTGQKVIELGVFADKALYDSYVRKYPTNAEDQLTKVVLSIINQVHLIYNYDSLDQKFKIVIVKLQILSGNEPSTAGGDIDKYLDNFCLWQDQINPSSSSKEHWDYAIMLTGLDVFKDGNKKVIGLAWVNGMCRSEYSCSISEGGTFEAGFVIAHEMGHSLGVQHDGDGNSCNRDEYLMSPKTGAGKVKWSTCSNSYMKTFLGQGWGNCLKDDSSPPSAGLNHQANGLPGQQYSLKQQCQLALGSDHTPFQTSEAPFNNVCKELWCRRLSWAQAAHPALDGSPCGNGKWCQEGRCVSNGVQSGSSNNNNNVITNPPPPTGRNNPRQTNFSNLLYSAINFFRNFFG